MKMDTKDQHHAGHPAGSAPTYRSGVKPVCSHKAFALDGLLSRAAGDASTQVRRLPHQKLGRRLRQLNAILQAAALHARRYVDSVTKKAIPWIHVPNHRCHHRP